MASPISKVDAIGIPSSDAERSREFYVETLGLRARRALVARVLGRSRRASRSGSLRAVRRGVRAPDEIDRAPARRRRRSGARGARGERRPVHGETFDTGVCHMARFIDPDGNELTLHKRYAPYARAAERMIDASASTSSAVPVTGPRAARRISTGSSLGLARNPNSTDDDWIEFEAGNVTLALIDAALGTSYALRSAPVRLRSSFASPTSRLREGEAPGSWCRGRRRDLGLGRLQRRRLHGLGGERTGCSIAATRRTRTGRRRDRGRARRLRPVPVTDMEKAKHFYGEVLGLEQNPNSPDDDWIEYEAGNVTLARHDAGDPRLRVRAASARIDRRFRVPDVAAAKAQLEAAGRRGQARCGTRASATARVQRPGRQPHPPPPPLRAVSSTARRRDAGRARRFRLLPHAGHRAGEALLLRTCSAWRSRPRARATWSSASGR